MQFEVLWNNIVWSMTVWCKKKKFEIKGVPIASNQSAIKSNIKNTQKSKKYLISIVPNYLRQ